MLTLLWKSIARELASVHIIGVSIRKKSQQGIIVCILVDISHCFINDWQAVASRHAPGFHPQVHYISNNF